MNTSQNGYTVVRDLLPPPLVTRLIKGIEEGLGTGPVTPGTPKDFGLGLFARDPGLWPLLWHEPFLEAARSFARSQRLVLLPSVDTMAVNGSESGWHRDSSYDRLRGTDGPDDPRYGIVRAITYPSHTAATVNDFLLFPGSHHSEWEKPDDLDTGYERVGLTGGDVLFFDARLVHAGAPVSGTKHLIVLTFGPDNVLTWQTRTHELANIEQLGFSTSPRPEFGAFLAELDLLPEDLG